MNITINIDGHMNNILENLIKRGIVKTKSEAIRLGLLNLEDKYTSDKFDREEYNYSVEKRFMKDWAKEPEGVWESYLNEK